MTTNFIRILPFLTPEMESWLADKPYISRDSCGECDENFEVRDLFFTHDSDCIMFKLKFHDLVFTEEEIKICDAPFNFQTASMKARLSDDKTEKLRLIWLAKT